MVDAHTHTIFRKNKEGSNCFFKLLQKKNFFFTEGPKNNFRLRKKSRDNHIETDGHILALMISINTKMNFDHSPYFYLHSKKIKKIQKLSILFPWWSRFQHKIHPLKVVKTFTSKTFF